jgi:hypothetical protein
MLLPAQRRSNKYQCYSLWCDSIKARFYCTPTITQPMCLLKIIISNYQALNIEKTFHCQVFKSFIQMQYNGKLPPLEPEFLIISWGNYWLFPEGISHYFQRELLIISLGNYTLFPEGIAHYFLREIFSAKIFLLHLDKWFEYLTMKCFFNV